MKDSTVAVVHAIPRCDFCEDSPAEYDAKMFVGPWAYMCQQHFDTHSCGKLGTGWGQRLVTKSEST